MVLHKFTTLLKGNCLVKKYGQYLVGTTDEFGYSTILPPEMVYVIQSTTKKIMGRYIDEHHAHSLAKGLEERDQKQLSEEMDRVLRG